MTYYYSTITAQASRTIYHIPKIIIPSTSRSIRLVYLLIAASSNSVVLEKDLQHHWNVSRKEQEISSSINIIVAAIHLSNSVRCLFKASTKQLQYNGSYTFCSYNFTGFCYSRIHKKSGGSGSFLTLNALLVEISTCTSGNSICLLGRRVAQQLFSHQPLKFALDTVILVASSRRPEMVLWS